MTIIRKYIFRPIEDIGYASFTDFASYVVPVVVSMILFLGSFNIIPSGYVGLKSTMGIYKEDTLSQGLKFKLPLIQNIRKIDIKSRMAHYGAETTSSGDNSDGIINLPRITVLDQKNLEIGLNLSVRFRVDQNSVYEVFIKQGGNFFSKRINPVILEQVRNVLGSYPADEVSIKREEISNAIKTTLDEVFSKETLFIIESVNIRSFELDKIIKDRISSVEKANQEEKKLRYQVKQEEQTRLISVIKSKAAAEVRLQEANATASAKLIEAKAEAKANKLISQSISSTLVKYKEIEKWDGKLPTTVLGEGSKSLVNIK